MTALFQLQLLLKRVAMRCATRYLARFLKLNHRARALAVTGCEFGEAPLRNHLFMGGGVYLTLFTKGPGTLWEPDPLVSGSL